MAVKTSELRVTIRIMLWVKYYIYSLELFAKIFNYEPDADKVSRFITNYGVKYSPCKCRGCIITRNPDSGYQPCHNKPSNSKAE